MAYLTLEIQYIMDIYIQLHLVGSCIFTIVFQFWRFT